MPITRDAARSLLLSSSAPAFSVIDHAGERFALVRPTVGAKASVIQRSMTSDAKGKPQGLNTMRFQVLSLIACLHTVVERDGAEAPGVQVFDEKDVEALMALPSNDGNIVDDLGAKAAAALAGVVEKEAEGGASEDKRLGESSTPSP